MFRVGRYTGLVAAAAVALGLAAAPAQADEPIKVGYLQFVAFGTINIAEANGWFEEAGVDVELVLFDSGPPLLEAMATGAVELGALGGVPTLRTAAQEVFDLRIVSVVADVSSPAKIVSADSINSVEELRGKKVSIPWATTQHYLLGKALEQNGMTLDDVDLIQMEVLDAQAAFVAKRIDAFVPAPSALTRVLDARADSHILFETTDFAEPVFIYDLWAAPQSVLDEKMEQVVQVLQVFHDRAVPHMTSPETAAQGAADMQTWLNNVVGAKLTPAEIEQQIGFLTFFEAEEMKALATSGTFQKMLEDQSVFLQGVGILDSVPDFDAVMDLRAIDGL